MPKSGMGCERKGGSIKEEKLMLKNQGILSFMNLQFSRSPFPLSKPLNMTRNLLSTIPYMLYPNSGHSITNLTYDKLLLSRY